MGNCLLQQRSQKVSTADVALCRKGLMLNMKRMFRNW